MRELVRRSRRAAALATVLVLPWVVATDGAVKPRTVLILPYDASALEPDARWWAEGIAELMELGLSHHPAIAQIDTARIRGQKPEAWTEAAVIQAARATRVDAAIFGRLTKSGTDLVLEPKLLELKAGAGDVTALEPITAGPADVLGRLAALPVIYIRTLKITLTDAEVRRIERAAAPTKSLRAFEYFARGQAAATRRSVTAGRLRRSSASPRSWTSAIPSRSRRSVTCISRTRAATTGTTRRSSTTEKRSSSVRTTPTPTSAWATPRRRKATSTARSPPTRRRSPSTRSAHACT